MDTVSILQLFSIPIGIAATGIGVLAILKPQFMSKGFGIEVKEHQTHYVVAVGIRDVFIGLSVLTLFYSQEWRVLAFTSLFIAMVAVSDFLVVLINGDRMASFTHLAGAVFAAVYSAMLFIYL